MWRKKGALRSTVTHHVLRGRITMKLSRRESQRVNRRLERLVGLQHVIVSA
jgi:hypothetical protein